MKLLLRQGLHRAVGLAILSVGVSASNAAAQAWVSAKGEGSVSVSYQRISNTGHRLIGGFFDPGGRSVNMGLYADVDYALTNRLSFTAGIPFVFGKYTDRNPPPPPIPFLPIDQCHCWNSGWQDFGFTMRYNIVNRSTALTPFLSVGMPSHNYDFRGEAALGRHLKELRLGIDAGRRLDWISRRLTIAGNYTYAFVERPLGIPNNRSEMSVEGNFQLNSAWSIRGISMWRRTHGGLSLGSPISTSLPAPGEINTPERLFEHDRLLKDNNWRVGTGTAYAFENLTLFGTYLHYASGTDTHAGHAITLGVQFPFQF